MKRTLFVVIGLGALAVNPCFARGLGAAGELEHARANARAGGTLDWRDRQLLEQWGCTSGTRNEFCKQREDRARWGRRHYRHQY